MHGLFTVDPNEKLIMNWHEKISTKIPNSVNLFYNHCVYVTFKRNSQQDSTCFCCCFLNSEKYRICLRKFYRVSVNLLDHFPILFSSDFIRIVGNCFLLSLKIFRNKRFCKFRQIHARSK